MNVTDSLEKLLADAAQNNAGAFPAYGNVDYSLRYNGIAQYLNNEIHPHVGAGAVLADGGYLTDHGRDHVRTVMDRAAKLITSPTCDLSGYEIYILLVAIHLHDIGNVFGRQGHEARATAIMRKFSDLAGSDTPEKRVIAEIAEAHGGHRGGDRDKIGKLASEIQLLGHRVRPQLIAGILRLADELADDSFRAARFMDESGLLPKEAEVYHKFAQALHSVSIDHEGRQIRLAFEIDQLATQRKFGKGTQSEVYLLDEVFDRTIKTHLERTYCMRFLVPQIRLDSVNVTILIISSAWRELLKIGYRLEERGYPEASPAISCLAMTGFDGASLNAHLAGDDNA